MRVRRRLKAGNTKLRLSVHRSNRQLFAQVIDDAQGITLFGSVAKKGAAKELGKIMAEKAKERQIESVVFDRGPFKYHGIIASFANAAREVGLKF